MDYLEVLAVLDDVLLARLVDPVDHQPLLYVASEDLLYNPRRHRAFPVRDGIAVLLEDESLEVTLEEGDALERNASARWTASA